MQLGKVKPTATIVAQFAAGVEVEAIQHEGKIFLPAIAIGDFAAPAPQPERKSEPKPEAAPAPAAKPSAPAPAKSSVKTYTKDEMMEMPSKDLEKILRDSYGIDPDKFDGKNTNKKLRDLILDAQKKAGAKAEKPAPKEEPKEEETTEDNSEIVKKVAEALTGFDSGKLSRKKALSAIAEACDADTDDVSDLLDKFEDDGDADAEEFAETIVKELVGGADEDDNEEDGGSTEEPEGEDVEISDLEKGDKVAVWWNDDNQAWFTGEVASVKRGKVTVKYDDGTDGVLEPELHTAIKRIED